MLSFVLPRTKGGVCAATVWLEHISRQTSYVAVGSIQAVFHVPCACRQAERER